MIVEKKLIIGISIISTFIERYDESSKDSAVTDEEVQYYCKANYQCDITINDFEEMVDILNRICTRHDFINKHNGGFPFIFNRIISTECRKEYLEDIRAALKKELDNLSAKF